MRSLQRLAGDKDPMVADSALRRLELAHVAAGYYVPSGAEAENLPSVARAARAVADAIFPERAKAKD